MAQTEQNRPASELNCFEHAFINNFLPVGKKKVVEQKVFITPSSKMSPQPASMRQRGVGAIMQ